MDGGGNENGSLFDKLAIPRRAFLTGAASTALFSRVPQPALANQSGFEQLWSIPLENERTHLTVVDIDGDGTDEIAISDKVPWGSSTFGIVKEGQWLWRKDSHGAVATGLPLDVNGDGVSEVMFKGRSGLGWVRPYNDQGTAVWDADYPGLPGAEDAGDYDSDGKDEYITSSGAAGYLYLWDDDGSNLLGTADSNLIHRIRDARPVSNESLPELLISNDQGGLSLLQAVDKETITQQWSYNPSPVSDSRFTDIDGDGVDEILATYNGIGEVHAVNPADGTALWTETTGLSGNHGRLMDRGGNSLDAVLWSGKDLVVVNGETREVSSVTIDAEILQVSKYSNSKFVLVTSDFVGIANLPDGILTRQSINREVEDIGVGDFTGDGNLNLVVSHSDELIAYSPDEVGQSLPSDSKPKITDFQIESGEYTVGEKVSATVTVVNPATTEKTYFVGFSVRQGSDDRWRDNNDATGKSVAFDGGESKQIDLFWTVQPYSPSGKYDAITKVWKETSRDTLETALDRQTNTAAFTVNSDTGPISIVASRTTTVTGSPVSLHAVLPEDPSDGPTNFNPLTDEWDVKETPEGNDGSYSIKPSLRTTSFRPEATGNFIIGLTVKGKDGTTHTAFQEIIVEERSTLIDEYAPILHFHEEETFYPTRYEAYVRNANLHILDRTDQTTPAGGPNEYRTIENPTMFNLSPIQGVPSSSAYLTLTGNENDYETYDDNFPPTVYASIHPDEAKFNDEIYTAVTYWLFYIYDPKGSQLEEIKAHESDLETITLLLKEGEPRWLVVSQHNGGEVREWKKVAKSGTHPFIYPAKGAHSNYLRDTSTYGGRGFLIQLQFLSKDSYSTREVPHSDVVVTDHTGSAEVWSEAGHDYELIPLTGNEPWLSFPGMLTEDHGGTVPKQRRRWTDPGEWAMTIPLDLEQIEASIKTFEVTQEGYVTASVENVGVKPHEFWLQVQAKPGNEAWDGSRTQSVEKSIKIGTRTEPREASFRPIPDSASGSWDIRGTLRAYSSQLGTKTEVANEVYSVKTGTFVSNSKTQTEDKNAQSEFNSIFDSDIKSTVDETIGSTMKSISSIFDNLVESISDFF